MGIGLWQPSRDTLGHIQSQSVELVTNLTSKQPIEPNQEAIQTWG
jgi:hypothetical protein